MTIIQGDVEVQVRTLMNAGFNGYRIAKELGLKEPTVYSYMKKVHLYGTLPPKIKVYKGKIKGHMQINIKNYLVDNPTATLRQIICALELDVAQSTLCVYLKKYGLSREQAKREVLLSAVNKAKRLKFAQEMLKKDDYYLSRIFWTDETKVQAWPNGEIVFFRAPSGTSDDQKFRTPKKQNGGGGVMFWGAMTRYAWGPLHVVEGTINGDKYLKLLKEVVLPEFEASEHPLIFQQDNAPAHKKASVIEFLKSQNFETLEWPPQSPDLSPIEWVWNQLKMQMKALENRPRTPAKIREAILELWEEQSDIVRMETIDTFRERLEVCVKREGGLTGF